MYSDMSIRTIASCTGREIETVKLHPAKGEKFETVKLHPAKGEKFETVKSDWREWASFQMFAMPLPDTASASGVMCIAHPEC